MKHKKEHLGIKMKRLRAFRGLTQEDLAAAIGKTRSLISFYERTGKVSYYTLKEIADALGATPEEIESYEPGNAAITHAKLKAEAQDTERLTEIIKLQKEEIAFLKDTISRQWNLLNALSGKR